MSKWQWADQLSYIRPIVGARMAGRNLDHRVTEKAWHQEFHETQLPNLKLWRVHSSPGSRTAQLLPRHCQKNDTFLINKNARFDRFFGFIYLFRGR